MNEAHVLAIAGTTASLLSMLGGFLTKRFPVRGPQLVGAAGAVMLAGNLVVLGSMFLK